MVRVLAFQVGDTGSIPVGSTINAAIAQLVEHLPCKKEVVGSSPTSGTIGVYNENIFSCKIFQVQRDAEIQR